METQKARLKPVVRLAVDNERKLTGTQLAPLVTSKAPPWSLKQDNQNRTATLISLVVLVLILRLLSSALKLRLTSV